MPSIGRSLLFLFLVLVPLLLLPRPRRLSWFQSEVCIEGETCVLSALGPPEPPQSIEVFPQSDANVLVTWKKPSDTNDLDHYYTYVEGEDMVDTTTESRYFWTDLQPCKNYTFGVSSVSATGDMSEPILGDGRTDTERPPPPQNLQGESQFSTSVTLTWDKPDTLCDIEYYLVNWSLEGINPQSKKVTRTSFPVTNLLPDTTYIFSVSAYTSQRGGDEASIEETTAEEKPGPPEDLKAVGVSPYAINVSWSEPDIPPEYYKVEGLPCMYMSEDVFGLWYLIDGLEPCTLCFLTVTSMYDDGMMYFERTDSETLAVDPPPPTGCSVEAEEGVITVRWVRPDTDCFLGKYHVQWTSTKLWGDGAEESNSLNTSATQYSITGPVPYSEYTFEISSSIEGVFGSPASCSGTSLETPASPPTGLVAVAVDSTSVTIQWSLPEFIRGRLLGWCLYWTSALGHILGDVHITDPEIRVHTIVDLVPGKVYDVYVMAVNNAGNGEAAMLEVSTENDPGAPGRNERK